jgi:hypothetical protein
MGFINQQTSLGGTILCVAIWIDLEWFEKLFDLYGLFFNDVLMGFVIFLASLKIWNHCKFQTMVKGW